MGSPLCVFASLREAYSLFQSSRWRSSRKPRRTRRDFSTETRRTYPCSTHEPEVVHGIKITSKSNIKKELQIVPRLGGFRAPRHSGPPEVGLDFDPPTSPAKGQLDLKFQISVIPFLISRRYSVARQSGRGLWPFRCHEMKRKTTSNPRTRTPRYCETTPVRPPAYFTRNASN
jgi:hypothetical protein